MDPLSSKPPWSKGAGINRSYDLVRLVATALPIHRKPDLLVGMSRYCDLLRRQPARLEYSFGEHTFAIPQTTDGLEIMQTVMASGDRLTAATYHQPLPCCVSADGRACPDSCCGSNASQPSGPAVIFARDVRWCWRSDHFVCLRILKKSFLPVEKERAGFKQHSERWFSVMGSAQYWVPHPPLVMRRQRREFRKLHRGHHRSNGVSTPVLRCNWWSIH